MPNPISTSTSTKPKIKFAKSWRVDDFDGLELDGEPFPYAVDIGGPMLARSPENDGIVHVLWVPILINGSIPNFTTPRASDDA